MTQNRVGMIGIGLMGHGIATNILRAGWPLSYLDHPGNQPSGDLDAAGAVRQTDAHALARSVDTLLLCVTGSDQTEEILVGETGLADSLTAGQTVIDCSTGVPHRTEALARRISETGARFVDAAMTRTPREAEQGRLNLLIGGAPDDVATIEPLLDAFSENRFHAGPVGAGQKLKLVHNFVSLGSVALLGEAAACAMENDIPAEVLVDCLRRGGGYGAALDRVAPYLLEGDTSAMRFTNANAHKDLQYYRDLAESGDDAHDIADGILNALARLQEGGHGEAMLPEAAQHLRRRNPA